MNDRIYYTDPACCSFEAEVRRTFERDGRHAVVLDRTAFYPTSGGQPCDTGLLGETNVLDVLDEGAEIVHVVSGPIAVGARVTGEVDPRRRFDHMQQHTGQHVLSAAFDRLFDNRTMSFHMGADACSIDLAREMSVTAMEQAVAEANRIVFEDRPVSIQFVSEDEASRLPLRKEPARGGPLRLIEVRDFDLSACGGTHVARTGAIGLIVVLGSERFRGGSRVAFACGGRALRAFDLYRNAVAESVRVLSVLPEELPAAIERLQVEARDLRKSLGRMQESLAGHEAARLCAGAPAIRGVCLVAAVLDGWDVQGLKSIALSVTAHAATAVALVSAAQPASVVVARSPDVAVDAGKVLRELAAMFEGRGGGKPELAQGGGFRGEPAEIVAEARQMFERALDGSQRS